MAIGVKGFYGERLLQAREARSLNAVALSDLVGVKPSAISQYENKGQSPRPEILDLIAKKLNLPVHFFLKPIAFRSEPTIFYRSMSSATKSARIRAERRYEWFREIVDYLSNYFDFPITRLPELDVPSDFKEITALHIESLAEQARSFWSLGCGPITDMVRTLESNGIFVTRGNLSADTLDAFSELDDARQPYIFLGADKNNLVRSRFDAAHELAHLLLHKNIDKKAIKRASDFKLIENQAHHFAGAFLLPATSFVNELHGISLDSFRSLKGRWKLSIAAMIKRCEQLELIDENQAKRFWINRNRRGWREHEPLDDLPVEIPQLIPKSFQILVDEQVRTVDQILDDIRLPYSDIEELACLPKGFFGRSAGNDAMPVLKNGRAKVLPFRRA